MKKNLFLFCFFISISGSTLGMHKPYISLEDCSRNPWLLLELIASPKKLTAAGIVASVVWAEKCEYQTERNRVKIANMLDGYKKKNPLKHSWHIFRDIVLGASHRNWISHHFTHVGYQPGYGLVGSTWSGIKHTAEGLREVAHVKDQVEYWLNWFRNLKLD